MIDISFDNMQIVLILIMGKYILMQNKINDKDRNNFFENIYIEFMKIKIFSQLVF